MNLRFIFAIALAAITLVCHAATPRNLAAEVETVAGEEISNLDRTTQRVVSTVAVRLVNRGPAALEAPLHAAIGFATQGDLAQIRLEGGGALGGFGVEPYGTPYLDLSGLLPEGGLPPGSEVAFTLKFSRPPTLFATYQVVPHGVMNRAPLAVLDGPGEAAAATVVRFSGEFSSDPDGDAVEYLWNFGDGTSGAGGEIEHTFEQPGVYDVVLRVRDVKGLESRATRTVLVVPAGQFALARTRALDDCGLPLAGVTVTEFAPGGAERSFLADPDGYAVLGGDEGFYRWRFAKPGHVTVWRVGELVGGRVVLVASPWLTPEVEPTVAVGPLAGVQLDAADGSVSLEFPAGAISQPGLAGMTVLHGQSLPLPLPRGWSPLGGLVVRGPGELLESGVLEFAADPPAGSVVCLLRYDPTVPRWVVADAEGSFAVDAYGTWAVALADGAPTAPPVPVVGDELVGFAVADEPVVTAEGRLDPPQRTASLDPALVKTAARVDFLSEGSLASGRMFRTRVNEIYRLRGGAVFPSPEYDTTVFAYRDPGGPVEALAAEFPLRPIRLFGPAELETAEVRVEVLEAADFQSVVLGAEGGSLAAGPLRLALAAGVLTNRTVAELRALDPASLERLLGGLAGGGVAFQLGYGGGAELEVAVTGREPGGHFVLARVVAVGGREGLLPVLRMVAGVDGVARSVEPESGARLPGLVTGGTYVLVAVNGPQGLMAGRVLGVDSTPRAGMPVNVFGAPWLAASAAGDGRFLLLAPDGPGTVRATDPADGNTGEATFAMIDVAAGVEVEIVLQETGPRVVALDPGDGATGVRTVAPVVVGFSEPLDPAAFGPDALTVREEGGAVAVVGSLSLSGDGKQAEFLAANPLAAGIVHVIELAPTIRDRQGLVLEGAREFRFTTLPPENRGEGGQLVIYEPGAENVPAAILDRLVGYAAGDGSSHVIVHGSPGTADPRAPVILVNLTTGETATVLSGSDGGFASFLSADEEDFIEAVFVNTNGSRVTIPASRQLFDDGRVGLYRQGGILEASNEDPNPDEPAEVGIGIVPGTVDERVVIGLRPVTTEAVRSALAGELPEGGVALAGVIATHEVGDVDGIVDIEFKFDPSEVELPPGVTRPEDATFILTRVQEVDGQIVYEMIDTMAYDKGVLTTKRSPPDGLAPPGDGRRIDNARDRLKNLAEGFYKGLTFPEIVKKQFIKDIFDSFNGLSVLGGAAGKMKNPNKILKALGLPSIGDTVVHQLLLPIMIAQGTTTNIGGRVVATRVDDDGNSIGDLLPVGGALVTIDIPPVQRAGRLRPGQIVSTTNENGQFMMRLDVGLEGLGYVMSATHPRFPGQRPTENDTVGTLAQRLVGNVPEGGSQGLNVSLARLSFIIPNAPGESGVDETAPEIRASHEPLLPPVGMAAGDPGAVVTLAAFDNVSVAEFLVLLDSAVGTDGSELVAGEDFVITVSEPGAAAPRVERQVVVKSAKPGRILLALEAADASGNRVRASYPIDFARPPLVPDLGRPGLGPRVMSVLPASGSAGLIAFPEIRLRFSKELPAAAFLPGNLDWLIFGEGHRLVSARPGLDRREVFVRFTGNESGEVSLTIGPPLTDGDGKPFDQNPEEEGEQSHVVNYTLATPLTEAIPATHGGGVAMLGGVMFTLDRIAPGSTSSKVLVQRIDGNLKPVTLAELSVAGEAVDLAVIPSWSYIERPGESPRTAPVLAVMTSQFGGIDDNGNSTQGFKSLRFFDVSNPAAPRLIARGNVSFDPLSKIAKIAAVPPFLIYQEQSSAVTSLRVVEMASFILGHNATQAQRDQFPLDGIVGLDLNGDGDFTDPGERYPSPRIRNSNFFGDFFSYAPLTSAERLADFALGGRGLAGVVSTFTSGTPAVFRNILNGSDPADPAVGTFRFGAGQDPKRVAILNDLPVRVGGVPRLLDVAAISMRSGTTGAPSLILLDLSSPKTPRFLGEFLIPASANGAPQIPNSLIRRGTGELALVTSGGVLMLDSRLLLESDAAGRSLAVLGQISGLGGGTRSFVADPSGIVAVSASSNNKLAFTGPSFDILTLPGPPVPAETYANQSAEAIEAVLGGAAGVPLAKAANLTAPPGADDHYYVMARLPGGAAAGDGSVRLTLASLSFAGLPGSLAPSSVLPRLIVDAASRPPENQTEEGAPPPPFPVEFRARRLSDDPVSPNYNVFLAGPFTLHRALATADASRLSAALPQTFLRIDRSVFTGLAPGLGNGEGAYLNPFRPRFGGGRFLPGPGREALCDFSRNPLIFVPGVMASKLRTGRGPDAWLSVPNLALQVVLDGMEDLADAGLLRIEVFGIPIPIPGSIPAAVREYVNTLNKLELGPDGDPGEVVATDVLREIFLADQTVSVSQVQEPLLKFLRDDLGYREYEYDRDSLQNPFSQAGRPNHASLATLPDLFPFPYDWRLDNATNAARLAEYVRLIRETNPDVKNVDIVAHSMGGLVARRYMLENPGVVQNFISACSPFLGAAKSLNTLKSGDLGDHTLNFFVGLELGKRISRHMPALHQLLPSAGYFALGGRPLAERGWDLNGDGKAAGNLDLNGYRAALDGAFVFDPFQPSPQPMAAANDPFHGFGNAAGNGQDDWSADTTGAQFYHVVSVTQRPETISRVRALPRLIPIEPIPDVAFELPPLDFEDSDQTDSTDALFPDIDAAGPPVVPRSYRVEYGVEVDYGVGDGTVPALSQTRGYGSPLDLNAPGTVMLPLVSRDPRPGKDETFSHVEMLKNREFHLLLAGILEGSITRAQQPVLAIDVPGSATEGEVVAFSATVSSGPDGVEPQIVWCTGDGGFAIGAGGEHVFHDDGMFTVTCFVGYPDGRPGVVLSRQIVVSNAAPTAVLVAEGTPEPGAPLRFIARAGDAGGDDGLSFAWDTDDGTAVASQEFSIVHTFAVAGDYTVSVTVTDDEGASATAELSVTVAAGAEPFRTRERRDGGGGDEPEDVPPVEFADLQIDGHDVLEQATPRVAHDTTGLGGQLVNAVVDEAGGLLNRLRSVRVAPLGARTLEMRVNRLDPGGSASIPGKSKVVMQSATGSLAVRLHHHLAGGQVRSYEWRVTSAPGAEVELTIPWDELAALPEDERLELSSPTAFSAKEIPTRDFMQPAIEVANGLGTTNLLGLDLGVGGGSGLVRRSPGSPDPTLVDQLPVLAAEEAPDTVEGQEPVFEDERTVEGVAIPEGSIFTEIPSSLPTGSEPVASALAAMDPAGNFTASKDALCGNDPPLTPELAEQLRNVITEILAEAAGHPDFKRFVISMNDMVILEQGSGACLWKDNLAKCQAFSPTSSDRDFELFFPVWKSGQALSDTGAILGPDFTQDPTIIPGRRFLDRNEFIQLANVSPEEFARQSLVPDALRGNWYFQRPHGITAGGISLEEPPDPSDGEIYENYLKSVFKWRYILPRFVTSTLAGPATQVEDGRFSQPIAVIEVLRGTLLRDPASNNPLSEKSVFDHPATPAEVISFLCTSLAKKTDARRKLLPDTSFFPFRRDHAFMGAMSTEKPPPFGDDPLGDAGMGRSALLVKWALEGAFIPSGKAAGFNVGIDDQTVRSAMLQRVLARPEAFEPEGYELGLYQEFAMLRDNLHLRMEKVAAAGTGRRDVFGDYLTKHERKVLKKAGKAALRAALGRLVTEEFTHPQLFNISVPEFDGDSSLLTFEHWIAREAKRQIGMFAPLTADDFDNFVKAKIDDPELLCQLSADPAAVDAFLNKVFLLLSDNVQEETEDDFLAYEETLMDSGRPWEFRARRVNVNEIERGFGTLGGKRVNGRTNLLGIVPTTPPPDAKFKFEVQIAVRDGKGAGPLELRLESENQDPITVEDILIPEGKTVLPIKDKNPDGDPIFTVKRPLTGDQGTNFHSFFIDGIDEERDRRAANNECHLFSRFLDVPGRSGPDFPEIPKTRFVYRGLAFEEPDFLSFVANLELHKAELPPSMFRNPGLSEEEAAALTMPAMLAALDAKFDPTATPPGSATARPSGFRLVDVQAFDNNIQRTVLAHVAVGVGGTSGLVSPCISLAEELKVPLNFARVHDVFRSPPINPYLVVYEVPVNDPKAYRFLPTAHTPLPGAGRIFKRVNSEESLEVVQFGPVRFINAWVFEMDGIGNTFHGVNWKLFSHIQGEVTAP